MIDLRTTVVPKSDQLNADDLIGQTLTIKVAKVSLLAEADQPIAINYEGDNGKPYKPCKSMRRVLIIAWGDDGNKFVGRRMTLYRDEKVMFGGLAVGGIRISHMSDIDGPLTMALTATRASRKPYTVKPLKEDVSAGSAPPASKPENGASSASDLIARGDVAAKAGTDALRAFWSGLTKADQHAAGVAQLAAWKAVAAAADAPDVGFDDAPRPGSEPPPAGASDAVAPAEAAGKNASPGADQRQGAPADNDQAASAKGTGAGEAVASSSAATPAPAPKPVEPEPEQRAPAKAASPAPSKPQVSAEERRKLLLDDLTRTGERAAAQGRAALNEFIDELNGDEQAVLSMALVSKWRAAAKQVDAGGAR